MRSTDTSQRQFAVRFDEEWRLCTLRPAEEFGIGQEDREVWCCNNTSEMLGYRGEEDASEPLTRILLDQPPETHQRELETLRDRVRELSESIRNGEHQRRASELLLVHATSLRWEIPRSDNDHHNEQLGRVVQTVVHCLPHADIIVSTRTDAGFRTTVVEVKSE